MCRSLDELSENNKLLKKNNYKIIIFWTKDKLDLNLDQIENLSDAKLFQFMIKAFIKLACYRLRYLQLTLL